MISLGALISTVVGSPALFIFIDLVRPTSLGLRVVIDANIT